MSDARTSTTQLRIVVGLLTLTSLAAIGALVLVVVLTANARREAAVDSCRFVKGLVIEATPPAPGPRARARAYIAGSPLADCKLYAHRLVPSDLP